MLETISRYSHNLSMSNTTHKNGRSRRAYVPDPPPQPTVCAHPDCTAEGQYRAPKSRDRLNDYVWFCLDHIREYNQTWDYYAGMDQEEIERHMREDVVGGRPTWPLGQWGAGPHWKTDGSYKDFGFRADFIPDDIAEAMADKAARHKEARRRSKGQRLTPEANALAVLDLKAPVTFAEVKARYKTLVKRLHPDANGGDKSAEERLKVVNQAYSILKAASLG